MNIGNQRGGNPAIQQSIVTKVKIVNFYYPSFSATNAAKAWNPGSKVRALIDIEVYENGEEKPTVFTGATINNSTKGGLAVWEKESMTNEKDEKGYAIRKKDYLWNPRFRAAITDVINNPDSELSIPDENGDSGYISDEAFGYLHDYWYAVEVVKFPDAVTYYTTEAETPWDGWLGSTGEESVEPTAAPSEPEPEPVAAPTRAVRRPTPKAVVETNVADGFDDPFAE